MLNDMEKLLPLSAVGVATAGACYAMFRYLNGTLNENLRSNVTLWFLGVTPTLRWHDNILALFDLIFSSTTFSRRRIASVLSLTMIATLTGHVYLLHDALKADAMGALQETLSPGAGRLLFMLFAVNFPVEFVSVTKTRYLLGRAAKGQASFLRLGGFQLVDIISGWLLGGCGAYIEFKAFNWGDDPNMAFLGDRHLLTELVLASQALGIPTVHSFSITLYILAVLVVRLIGVTSRRIAPLTGLLNTERIEKEPITLVGEFMTAFVVVVFVSFGVLFPPH